MAYLKHTRLFEYSNKNASYPETRREFARESQLNDIISAPVMRTLVEWSEYDLVELLQMMWNDAVKDWLRPKDRVESS